MIANSPLLPIHSQKSIGPCPLKILRSGCHLNVPSYSPQFHLCCASCMHGRPPRQAVVILESVRRCSERPQSHEIRRPNRLVLGVTARRLPSQSTAWTCSPTETSESGPELKLERWRIPDCLSQWEICRLQSATPLNASLSLIERPPSLGHVSRLQFTTEDAHNSSFLEAAGWICHSLRS